MLYGVWLPQKKYLLPFSMLYCNQGFLMVWQLDRFFIGSMQFCVGDVNQVRYPWIPEIALNAYLHPAQTASWFFCECFRLY